MTECEQRNKALEFGLRASVYQWSSLATSHTACHSLCSPGHDTFAGQELWQVLLRHSEQVPLPAIAVGDDLEEAREENAADIALSTKRVCD